MCLAMMKILLSVIIALSVGSIALNAWILNEVSKVKAAGKPKVVAIKESVAFGEHTPAFLLRPVRLVASA